VRARLELPPRYTPDQRRQLALELDARLAALAGVRAVAVGSDLPLGGDTSAAFLRLPGADSAVRYYRHRVAPGYFSALGIRLLEGRAFSTADHEHAPAAAVVSQSMARRFWPGGSPLGETLRLGESRLEATVVGVVADTRQRDLTTPLASSDPDVYLALQQSTSESLQIAVRSTLAAEAVAAAVRRELQAIDPTLPVFGVQSMEALLAQQTSAGRFASLLLGVFAAVALLLAAVGLYGVLAFVVSLRQREIGIRLALGATRRRVLAGVMRQGLRLVGVGLAIGLLAAAGSTRWISSLLFGVGAHDPAVFAGVPAVLLAVAALASWAPARRAAGVDPQQALRSE
jgi:predicted permease